MAWAQNEVSSFPASNSGPTAGEPGISVGSGGSTWSLLGPFQHFWAPQWSSAITVDYANQSAGTYPGYTLPAGRPFVQPPAAIGGFSVITANANLVWSPVTGFMAGLEGGDVKPSMPGPAGTGSCVSSDLVAERSRGRS